jgi:diacylglycerol O-acyltransferase 1
MNLRLMLENFKKYGILITLKFNIAASDVKYGLLLYALTPCHLFVAYIIERIAMENAMAALGRKKKSDTDLNKPESEKDRKDFYYTWWWIAVAHAVNATFTLLVTSAVIYWLINNPGIGTICELHAVVVWLKTCSYAFTNRDLRHAMLHPTTPSNLPEIYAECPYPKNITISNLIYFWLAPTLVYQTAYPRSTHIRWIFVLKRFLEVIGLSVFIWLASAQYAAPVLRNSLDKMALMDLSSILERLMKLSTISLIIWLAGFFALFQSFLNALAEILHFGDRNFYDDWWNSTSLKEYWATWNKPVHHFMRRHVYSPLLGRGWSPHAASAWVFIFSGFLHELCVGVPTHNILGVAFLGMVMQLPLIYVTEPLSKMQGITGKVVGNCIFWINFCFIGQPLAALVYYYAWQANHGGLPSANATSLGGGDGGMLGGVL